MPPLRVIVRGGSIGGITTAHSLLRAGCEVVVYEQAPSVVAAGAGIGLDQHSSAVMDQLGLSKEFERATLPMPVEVNHAVRDRKLEVLFRDSDYNNRSTHWATIHQTLLKALPSAGKGMVHYAHKVKELHQAPGSSRVKVKVSHKVSDADEEEFEDEADLVVAADGSMSETRAEFHPKEPRRYAGYCAWRGVLQKKENPEVFQRMQEQYSDFGSALYFEIAQHSHAVVYLLPEERLNWLWYENQPLPELKGPSVTVKATEKEVSDMKQRAGDIWPPALASLMQATATPFVNALFDREPLDTFVYGRVVLLGEAAHPTTPHGLRSTNMAIADAHCLGQALTQHEDDTDAALQQYDKTRVPATRKEVLFSRWLGMVKQGWLHGGDNYAWQQGSERQRLIQQLPQCSLASFEPAQHKFADIQI